ncbi:MAG: metal ABC transporter permease [Cellulosilyticaceae bacterium]
MEQIYAFMDIILPFSFLKMDFMKNALLGILLAAPVLGLLSTMIVNQKMAFFSDAIGHSALTGIGIGVLMGFTRPTVAMLIFAILLAVGITFFSQRYGGATDTVIGVFSAGAIALGTMILSRGGNFNQYTSYLIGDILSIEVTDLRILLLVGIIIGVFWLLMFNPLIVVSLNPSLAGSRKIPTFRIQLFFTIVVAVVVVLCIPWIGILLINAFLILPGAIAKNLSKNIQQFHIYSVLIALICGVVGLVLSYYFGVSTGATVVLCMAVLYVIGSFIRR